MTRFPAMWSSGYLKCLLAEHRQLVLFDDKGVAAFQEASFCIRVCGQ